MPNHDPEYYPQKKENAQDRDLAPILGDMSQSETLSEIKSPLDTYATKQDFEIWFSIAIS